MVEALEDGRDPAREVPVRQVVDAGVREEDERADQVGGAGPRERGSWGEGGEDDAGRQRQGGGGSYRSLDEAVRAQQGAVRPQNGVSSPVRLGNQVEVNVD